MTKEEKVQFTQKFLIEEVLKNDLRRDETEAQCERYKDDPYLYNHGHVNGVPLYILHAAIKKYNEAIKAQEKGLRRKRGRKSSR